MNDNDLAYLLRHTRKFKRNTYKHVSVGTNSSHILYMNHKQINFKSEKISNSITKFDVFDMSDNELFSFQYPHYPNNQPIALEITGDKLVAEKHFKKCGINTSNSSLYGSVDVDLAFEETFKDNPNKKVVIKPKGSSQGRGVFVNVTKETFRDLWQASINDLSLSERKRVNSINYLVQDIIEGFEARATIMQGNLISVVVRIPPYVVGDGVRTINQLIERTNRIKKKCNYQSKFPLKITRKIESFLSSTSRNLETIPDNLEPVLLSSVSNISGGGELFNITDLISDNIRNFILDAIASVPGMYSGGLDIMLKSFNDTTPAILEANVYPNITNSKYPTYGNPSKVSKIVIDSLIAQHQIGNDNIEKYDIENQDYYIKNFIDLTKRKQKFNYINYSSKT